MAVQRCQHRNHTGRCQQCSVLATPHAAALCEVMVCFCPTPSGHLDTTTANTLTHRSNQGAALVLARRKTCPVLLCPRKVWPVTLGWCHSTGSPGPALTFPLQKHLQILIQALLVVQHKFEDGCQLNLCQRSRGVSSSAAAAAVRRQSSVGGAATTAGAGQQAAPRLPTPALAATSLSLPRCTGEDSTTHHAPSFKGTQTQGQVSEHPPKGTSASPHTPGPEGELRRDYLGLVVKLIPVPGALAAHGGVIQEQHGHLKQGREASPTPCRSSVPARNKACPVLTLANASSSPSRSSCAETRFSAADLCLQCSAR